MRAGLLAGFFLVLATANLFTAAADTTEQLEPHNAVSFYVANTGLSQWLSLDEGFRTELAESAESFCSHSQEDCNIVSSASVTFSRDDVVYYTGFPTEIDGNLRIVFGVSLPPEQALALPAYLPQAPLASILLINQPGLQAAVGNLIGLVELYTQEDSTPAPSEAPEPTLEAAIENAILIILTQASLADWEDGSFEQQFREAVAEVASDHCTNSPASCNIASDNTNIRRRRSDDITFEESSVYIIPEFPKGLDDSEMEIAFAVTIPVSLSLVSGVTDHFIPQSALLSLSLNLSPVLAESTGAYIIGISAYQPRTEESSPSLWSQIWVGVTVPSLILLLLLIGIPTGVTLFWLKKRKHKEVYNVSNYVRGVEKGVEMVRMRPLRGVYSPVQSEANEMDDDLCELGDGDEDVMSEGVTSEGVISGGETYGVEGERSDMLYYYSAEAMFHQPRPVVLESETASSNHNTSGHTYFN